MTCPKCGFVQANAPECKQCGIVIEKYKGWYPGRPSPPLVSRKGFDWKKHLGLGPPKGYRWGIFWAVRGIVVGAILCLLWFFVLVSLLLPGFPRHIYDFDPDERAQLALGLTVLSISGPLELLGGIGLLKKRKFGLILVYVELGFLVLGGVMDLVESNPRSLVSFILASAWFGYFYKRRTWFKTRSLDQDQQGAKKWWRCQELTTNYRPRGGSSMFSYTKREVTARELGGGLIILVHKLEKLIESSEEEMMKELTAAVGRERVLNEILYLLIFTVDLAVYSVLGNTPEKSAVLDAFYAHLREMTKDTRLFPEIDYRLVEYASAIREWSESNNVGTTFMKFCGVKSLEVAFAGFAIFAWAFEVVSESLKSLRII